MMLHLPRLKKMVGELLLPPPPPRSQTIGVPPLPPRLDPLLQLELPRESTLADSPCLVDKELPRSTSPHPDPKPKVHPPGSSLPTWLRNRMAMAMAMVVLLKG